MLRMLDRKLVRDFLRLWAQIIAVALVMGCGVMTIVLALGSTRSLEETRTAFYERSKFASVFASATRAPLHLRAQISAIDGVSAVELRIVKQTILDIEGMPEPASGIVVSLPDYKSPGVNDVYLRKGRLPEPTRPREVAVLAKFAEAHGFRPSDRFQAVMNGQKRELEITGTVLAPEYVYAIGPGDMVPDERRFGVFFMSQKALSSTYDLEGAFNNVVVTTRKNADIRVIVEALDRILKPFGGTGAFGREDQNSHAFLDSELKQLRAMATVIPPVFLFVSAFLVNMIMSRLIALEREQIGLLKAVGYSTLAVGWHYAKLVIAICLIGILIGSIAGTWLGRGLTQLYGSFFSFPFLVFAQSIDLYFVAAFVTIVAALAGAAKAIWVTVKLPPAVAMRPPAPTRYQSFSIARHSMPRLFSPLTTMAIRHLIRWPMRSALTIFGTSLSVGLLITALFTFDSIDHMIDTIFFQTQRQDATITFTGDLPPSALSAVRNLPGVLQAEGFRTSPVTVQNKHIEKTLVLQSHPASGRLTQILDVDGKPIEPTTSGVLLTARVAEKLKVKPGSMLAVELLSRENRKEQIPVVGTVNSLVGLSAYIGEEALDRAIRTGPRINGAHVQIDESQLDALYQSVKETPGIVSVALLGLSRDKFRATIEENIVISVTVYVVLAVIITFGVIYNSARIQLSERARELASLRVFGFTRAEVSSVLLTELTIIVILAQPVGWLLGYGLASLVVEGFASDLFRLPLIINQSTYSISSFIVIVAAAFSAFLVRRRIDGLDLIRVLKTRE